MVRRNVNFLFSVVTMLGVLVTYMYPNPYPHPYPVQGRDNRAKTVETVILKGRLVTGEGQAVPGTR